MSVGAPELNLRDHLRTQLAILDRLDPELEPYLDHLINHLNDMGYLDSSLDEIAQTLPEEVSRGQPGAVRPRLEAALSFLQKMEPAGVGAPMSTPTSGTAVSVGVVAVATGLKAERPAAFPARTR